MIKATLRFGVLLSTLLALTVSLQGQTPFWTQDFAGGIPAGWTNVDASGQGVIFEWCNDPQTNGGDSCPSWFNDAINEQDPFAATTAANGFVSCDSDEYGPLANDHIVRFTTTAIDCSALSEVWVEFQSHIGVFTVSAVTGAVLRVSTDNTNWTTYTPYPDLTTSVRWSGNPEVVVLDISATAAGSATVYLQWEWTGNWEYQWSLDDIALYDQNPTPPNDMQVTNWFAVAPNLLWPLSMVEPFGFLADVVNVGSADQTNVTLNLTLEDEGGNVVFTEDLDYGTIAVDTFAYDVPFAGTYTPTEMGVYTGTYTLTADAVDSNPADNSASFEFVVNDTLFAKETSGFANRPADSNWDVGEAWSWAYGNYFYVPEAGDNIFKYVFFALEVPAALAGENVTVSIYKWEDENKDGEANPTERGNSIATMIYALTGEELVSEIIALPITTLAGNPVALEDETGYIVMVEFQTDQEGTTIDMGFSQDVNYGGMISSSEQAGAPRYGSLLGVAGNLSEEPYSTVGFGFDVVPVVRFSFGEPSSAKDILLDGNFSVFPNPVSNEISLDMNFTEVMEDVTVQLFDLNGKLLGTKILDNVKQQTATFDVRALANGAYFLKVTTEKGTRSERFQVQR